MSGSWSLFVIILTAANIIGALVLLQLNTRRRGAGGSGVETTGHTWDGNLAEYNNPLPMWWLLLFWITGAFCFVYLALYPGFGSFKGLGGWSSAGQYDAEMKVAEQQYARVFGAFAKVPVAELARDPAALQAGRNLFLNNCAVCHGSDGKGAIGFPNLTDHDWLYGGTPDDIVATITNGRTGVMPAWGTVLGEQGVGEVVAYVTSLSGKSSDAALAEAGQTRYMTYCVACHGADGKGNQALGAPNLTDNIWLYGGTAADIRNVITNGRQGQMPAQLNALGAERIHTLAAYVLSLSGGGANSP